MANVESFDQQKFGEEAIYGNSEIFRTQSSQRDPHFIYYTIAANNLDDNFGWIQLLGGLNTFFFGNESDELVAITMLSGSYDPPMLGQQCSA